MDRSRDPFPQIKDHVLLRYAGDLRAADASISALLSEKVIRDIVALIPDTWLTGDNFASPGIYRGEYIRYLLRRLEMPHTFVEEAIRARSLLV